MKQSGMPATGVAREIDRLVRADGGRLLAHLVAHLRDFQLAEDSLQDALEAAFVHWARFGVPGSPSAWLMRTARRKAIDRLRRVANFRSKERLIADFMAIDQAAAETEEAEPIADERLKLIFTCCHPALERGTSVALTLRSICGLRTEEIARAFVVTPDAMAQRLVRARPKIAKAGIAYAVPGPEGWSERLNAVLAVIYLIFNEGYAASSSRHFRSDLCEEAIRLGRLLNDLIADEPEIEGLLALLLLHHARGATRMDETGELIALEAQDRKRWDRRAIAEGTALVERALRRGRPATYQLQAAIAAIHAEAPSFDETDWAQIALIYERLSAHARNPVFDLNRLVARSYCAGPRGVLDALFRLEADLGQYQPFHAAKADLLARSGEHEAALAAFETAIALSATDAEKSFLRRRVAALEAEGSTPGGAASTRGLRPPA